MEQPWFKKTGWLFLPVHPLGYIVTLLAVIFMIPVIMTVLRNGHSASDDLYEIFVYGTCTAFWWKWVAEKTSDAK
ncbi:MAG: hypothetical protein JWP81_5316 [Ferruginibacter sp.]|nr:hypothetical protein [Ferruginibacter sp.]